MVDVVAGTDQTVHMTRWLVLGLGVATFGCPTPTPAIICDDAAAIAFEVGSVTNAAFRSLAVGDDVEFVVGPQGGFHIDASVRIGCLDVQGAVVRYELRSLSNQVIASSAFQLNRRLVTQIAIGVEHLGDRVVFNDSNPRNYIGQHFIFAATLRSPADVQVATWSQDVRLVDDVP